MKSTVILFILTLVVAQHVFAGTISSTNAERLRDATAKFVMYEPKYQDTMYITIEEDPALEIRIKLEVIRDAGIDPLQFANLLINSNLKMTIERNGAYFDIINLTYSAKKSRWAWE